MSKYNKKFLPEKKSFKKSYLIVSIFLLLIMFSSIKLISGAQQKSANFIVETPDPAFARQVAQAAEFYRAELANYWGCSLPGNWAQPCPLEVQVGPNLGNGGATTFSFDRGEVFGWRMSIQGNPQRLLDSVLPHEINHMVFASHLRKPVPRWADEGAATSVEHASEKNKHREMILQFLRTGRGISLNMLFAMTEYPRDVMPMYAEGYSVTQYLLLLGGPKKFMKFLELGMGMGKTPPIDWNTALQQVYGMDVNQLNRDWLDWVRKGQQLPGKVKTTSPGKSIYILRDYNNFNIKGTAYIILSDKNITANITKTFITDFDNSNYSMSRFEDDIILKNCDYVVLGEKNYNAGTGIFNSHDDLFQIQVDEDISANIIIKTINISSCFKDTSCQSDFNNDGKVDESDNEIFFADYIEFNNCTLSNNWCNGTDLNKNGDIGLPDKDIFDLSYGKVGCPVIPISDNCIGKQCGVDVSGNSCGTCPDKQECNSLGQCINVIESCTDKTCNDYNSCTVDSCNALTANCIFTPIPDGTSCDLTSSSSSPLESFINFFERTGNLITNFLTNKQSLSVCKSGQCISCIPKTCTDINKKCGSLDDGCGNLINCGTCSAGQTCNSLGQCIASDCTPDCSGKQCGTDPICGTSCGTCSIGQICNANQQCILSDCTPDCSGKQCGSDSVCGISCGTCPTGQTCNLNQQCISCTPQCTNKQCGDDSCNGICGSCLGGQTCNLLGKCIASDCIPDCSGKQCGTDPVCGISCGICASGQTCNANQQCITNPTPNIKCNKNSDCGIDSWTGNLFCQNSNVYQNYITYSCNNPGSASSSCSNSTSALLKQTCSSSQSCSNGVCVKKFKTTTIGLYNPLNSNFYLRNSNTQGNADITFAYGAANNGWTPIAGDWDGDGKTTIGFYETNPTTSKFYLRNSNTAGYADLTFSFGAANKALIPITGDWDGDGKTTIGLFDLTISTFYLRNSNTQGYADITFAYGAAGTGLPISGDWDGDGKTTIGLYNPTTSTFYLRNSNSAGYADITFAYGAGNSGWKPIAGDWDSDGKTTIGLYNPITSTFYLRNTNTAGYADITFAYGAENSGWKPIAGNWN